MLPEDKIKDLQKLYPTPLEKAGFNARQPTVFKLGIVTLSPLLFLPPFFIIALFELYMNTQYLSKISMAESSIAFISLFMISGVVAVAMLLKARGIVIRNSSHPLIVSLLYLLVILPIGYMAANWSVGMYADNIFKALGIFAGAFYVLIVIFIVLIRRLNHEPVTD